MSDFINKDTFQIRHSVHDPDYEELGNWFICNDMDIPDCENKYKKWNDEESKVEEMSQVEKDIVDLAIIEARVQAEENAKDIDNMEKLTKALGLVILDEINILRKKVGLQERTISQLKNTVKAKYESL